jgi:DNA modification methylase
MPLDREKAMKRPRLAPGGGGCWIGGPATESTEKFNQGSAKVFGTAGNASEQTGTSIFDPVLCEIAYRWFSPPKGVVLDPFAGGSVRGIVAAKLGRQYVGVDLRAEQIAANIGQLGILAESDPVPMWHCGDSRNIDVWCAGVKADLVFSCPPYADLERYSDDPADISNMSYPKFLAAYREIIKKTCALLMPDRFACFVVGEVRGKRGAYYDFVGDTVRAFMDAGLSFYNEAILVTAVGSLPIRVAKQFTGSRKLGKTHQNVLVFCKGDPRKAAAACGDVEVADELLVETPAEG